MKKVMVVEDHQMTREELVIMLVNNGYEVISIEDFSTVYKQVEKELPDLILLDINLPGTSGYTICQEIRATYQMPIVFVTSRDSDKDELKGIELGGDDFIKKPYNQHILLAKIKRILETSDPDYHKQVVYNDVILDLHLMVLSYNNQDLDLTKNEFKILYYLFLNREKAISKDELIEYLWDNKLYIDENTLNVNMARLRKKIASIGLNDFIKTIPKRGYHL